LELSYEGSYTLIYAGSKNAASALSPLYEIVSETFSAKKAYNFIYFHT